MRDAKITQIHEGRNSSVSLSGGRCSEPWAKLAKERHAIVVTCNVRQREKPGCSEVRRRICLSKVDPEHRLEAVAAVGRSGMTQAE